MTSRDNRRLDLILAAGIFALVALPWYRIRSGFFSLEWLPDFIASEKLWPGLVQALTGNWQFWPILGLIAAAVYLRATRMPGERGKALIVIGVAGLLWMVSEGLALGLRGWNWGLLEATFGPASGQPAFGAGALVLVTTFALLIAFGAAERGL